MTDAMPEIRLEYQGEQQGPFPPGHKFAVSWFVWALSYNGDSWSEFKNNRDPGESRVCSLASMRVAMNTEYRVVQWQRVGRHDDVIELRAELANATDDGPDR